MASNSKKRKIDEQENGSVEFPPPFTTDVLHHRLQTGIMVQSGGQKGSLTRCVQKYAVLCESLNQKDVDSQEIKKQKRSLLQDLKLYQMDLTRKVLLQQTLEKERKENEKAAHDLKREIEDADKQVKESFQQADRAKQIQSCFVEYEALARLAKSKSSISSRQLRAEIQKVKEKITEFKKEEAVVDSTLRVRSSQAQALIQCMLDLKRSIDGDDWKEEIETAAKESAETKENDDEDNSKPAAMEEDDLYGDVQTTL
eukprot:scaffold1413_cov117-Cylindrotheca_fusiformis.AAC.12